MRRTAPLLLAAVVLAAARPAEPHGMRTVYVELSDAGHDAVLATVKTVVPDPAIAVAVAGCTPDGDAGARTANVWSFFLRCPGGITGRRVAVDGLGPISSEAVVRLLRPDGVVLSRIVTRDEPAWVIPDSASWRGVAIQYVGLGVAHIATGLDHLLFLLALVLYVRRPRAVLVTETAFTLSHSVSFAATALGLVHVSAPAAEACIALSLVLVALDVGADRAGDPARRAPLIALVFGLVHGLGFAGALSDVGLPDRDVAAALVAFGAGIEIGQVAFLLVVMTALALVARAGATLVPRIALAGSYLVGVTGAYWLVDRLWRCFA
jgi:hydrogenase/urease accessory protein HupE